MQLGPCAVLALISHPTTKHAFINRLLWAFCVYVEAVAVAPQVRPLADNLLRPCIVLVFQELCTDAAGALMPTLSQRCK